MYYEQVEKINRDIDRTGRAIVALGCSFVQGQGAVNDELYQDYTWHYEKLGVPLALKVTEAEKQEILKKYPNVSLDHQNNLSFTQMEYDNAFCNVLATKYFEGSYAAINLGIRGCGNRGTIKELYFHPNVHWDKLKEIIVVYCPSGLERFDFVNDGWWSHHHWVCMWPHFENFEEGPRKLLAEGYAKRLYSDKFEVIEQISHVQELMTWCKLHNAKLIITSGFDGRYTKDHFKETLNKRINRQMTGPVTSTEKITDLRMIKEHERLLQLWPWDNMFLPDGCPTFADFVLKQEFPNDWKYRHFFQYNGEASPDGWFTSCAHPSAKGHDAFAKSLYHHIKSGG